MLNLYNNHCFFRMRFQANTFHLVGLVNVGVFVYLIKGLFLVKMAFPLLFFVILMFYLAFVLDKT